MDATMIRKEEQRFKRARINLLLVVFCTLVNIVIIALDGDLSFLFSAFFPQLIFILLMDYYWVAGITIAALCIVCYLLCYLLSKKCRVLMLIALILFALDALVLLAFIALSGEASGFMFNIAFSAWILYYLITGTVAWVKLRNIDPETLGAAALNQGANPINAYTPNDAMQAFSPTFDDEPYHAPQIGSDGADDSLNAYRPEPEPVEFDPSIAIRPESKRGKVFIKQSYNDMVIVVKRAIGVTELVIDGMVYAEERRLLETEPYALVAYVDNVVIKADMDFGDPDEARIFVTIRLFVNGVQLASKRRLY